MHLGVYLAVVISECSEVFGSMRTCTHISVANTRRDAVILAVLLMTVILILPGLLPTTVAAQGENNSFVIVVLPDTQYYSRDCPEILNAQTAWIVANKERLNIKFVTHEGDLVQSYRNEDEWKHASNGMSVLDGEVPYGVLPGNHDFRTDSHFSAYVTQAARVISTLIPFIGLPGETGGEASRLYNTYFPYSKYEDESWYGGHYGDTNDNNYQLFSAGGEDFVILHLQYDPPREVLEWADSILHGYPDRMAIVTTHSLLDPDGTRNGIGENIYHALKNNDNLFLMLCGHMHAEAKRYDIVDGHRIYQLLADYQERTNGGDGWLRIMEFVPDEGKIYVQTYSPYIDAYETDEDSQFVLDYHDETMTGYQLASQPGKNSSSVWDQPFIAVFIGLGLGIMVRKGISRIRTPH